jgi:perosamine synthetase
MTSISSNKIIKSLSKILTSPVGLHEPEFSGKEWEYVKDCLDTGWVSSAGKYVEIFEDAIADFTGAAYAIATVNGTAALHTCLMLSGVKTGDEVLMPALTFVGTANSAAGMGAIPHFVDVEELTLGLDPIKLEAYLSTITKFEGKDCKNKITGRKIAACISVHTFGHPVNLDPLVDVCRNFNIPLIEDAAESLGSYYKKRHTGNHGLLAALSFNGNKTITTGGGGVILCKDADLAAQAKHMTSTAKVPHRWEYCHDQIGYNYRLPNINAALGCAQMEQLPFFLKQKRILAKNYEAAFADVEGVRFFIEPEFAESNYWLNVLLLDSDSVEVRNEILAATNDFGFMTRPVWTPMHRLTMYEDCPKMNLSVSENLCKRIINIPSSPRLAKE